jgi:hypothetical protein
VFIKAILDWVWFHSDLSQILNTKLPSFVVLDREELKRHFCAVPELVNRGIMTIGTNSTDFLPESISMVAVNYCDPFCLPSIRSTWFPSCSVFIPRTSTWIISVLRHLGWLSHTVVESMVGSRTRN